MPINKNNALPWLGRETATADRSQRHMELARPHPATPPSGRVRSAQRASKPQLRPDRTPQPQNSRILIERTRSARPPRWRTDQADRSRSQDVKGRGLPCTSPYTAYDAFRGGPEKLGAYRLPLPSHPSVLSRVRPCHWLASSKWLLPSPAVPPLSPLPASEPRIQAHGRKGRSAKFSRDRRIVALAVSCCVSRWHCFQCSVVVLEVSIVSGVAGPAFLCLGFLVGSCM